MKTTSNPRAFFPRFLFGLLLLVVAFLCFSGIAIAFVISADHISEFMNGWDSINKWEPFPGNYFESIVHIPENVAFSVKYFPEACFITLIFYPLVVILIAFYEVSHGDFAIVTMGWAPFLTGVGLLIWGGFFLLREPEGRKIDVDKL